MCSRHESPVFSESGTLLSRGDSIGLPLPRSPSAVSEAGGLGLLSSLSFPDQEALRKEIRRMREMTQKPFGVNLSMLPELTEKDRTEEILQVIIDEGVPVVETSGRSPEPFVQAIENSRD